jgi:hypothetical protein
MSFLTAKYVQPVMSYQQFTGDALADESKHAAAPVPATGVASADTDPMSAFVRGNWVRTEC